MSVDALEAPAVALAAAVRPKLITLAIPFHNEGENLEELLSELISVIAGLPYAFEVLLVDDMSSDGGAEVVRRFAAKQPAIRLIQLSRRGGQSGAFQAAFDQAQGDFIIRMDSDLQDDPCDLPLLLGQIESGHDLVMGLRTSRRHPRTLRILSQAFDLLVLLFVNSPLHAHSGSFVAFRADLVQGVHLHRNDHRYLPLIAIRRGVVNATEVVVRHRDRKHGTSHYRLVRKVCSGVIDSALFFGRLVLGFYDRK
jgi:glycosyltransferase involved in cell wall biosynthesis